MVAKIPVFKPYLGVDTVKAATDALDVGWLGMGSFVKEFEESLADYLVLKERYVVAVNTGTSALHLAMLIAGVGSGNEVITPSFNNIADIQAILMAGAEPVFCDICEDDLGIDVEKAEALISPTTKAIIGMDYGGIPCKLDELYALANRYGLRVIHDASHSIGSYYKGQPIGSFGDIVVFSFDPVKTLTTIDGGALVVNSVDDAQRLHAYRLLGMDQSVARMYSNNRAWTYDVADRGFRYHLANLHASVGLSQLSKIDEFIANRQRYCRLYSSLLKDVDGVRTPQTDFTDVAPFHYYMLVEDGRRDRVITCLEDAGIDTGIHWLPAHNFTLSTGFRRGDLSVTERIGAEVLTLPMHSYMDTEVVERIACTITGFFE